MHQVIRLHSAAPAKPGAGQPCNGCGLCCATQPCPVGMLISGKREGRCDALQWRDDGGLYRCGLIESPAQFLPWLLRWTAPMVRRWARRLIAAGQGCDCSYEVA
ncbi:hypothetical protein [Piscinibacter terrae]|uniref:4Fe-4S ferredoxin-type domain-containing protein n=1 Tax=Piscinibacter terrae TaxID=2496871 RepID=A0A3N7HIR3_9BURK|nr:hypothetical protein [Albitalea terrae]RQP21924.1 hypothetical protein DZC73_26155 [Albitalea terrae]